LVDQFVIKFLIAIISN